MLKLNKPKIKFKYKLKFNNLLLAMLVLVIAAELYFAFTHLYKNSILTPEVKEDDKVVRVDNAAYKTVIEIIKQLPSFVASNPVPQNPNPFR